MVLPLATARFLAAAQAPRGSVHATGTTTITTGTRPVRSVVFA